MEKKFCIECDRDINDPKSFNGYCSTCFESEELKQSSGGINCACGQLDCVCNLQEEPEENKFVTIFDLAKFRGVKEINGSVNAGAFIDVGLPFMGGCQNCGASCAAYNMCPTNTGNCSCLDCIHTGIGFETADEANRFCFPNEYKWQGVKVVETVSHDLNYDSQDYNDDRDYDSVDD